MQRRNSMNNRYRPFRLPDDGGDLPMPGGTSTSNGLSHPHSPPPGQVVEPLSRQNSSADLAYSNLLMNQDGTVMTRDQLRELRDRQGYCLTCPGEPVKLYDIKKSKLNPLWKGKDAVDVMHESYKGVCLRCNPSMDPHRSQRRNSMSTERRYSGSHAGSSVRSLGSFSTRTPPQGTLRPLLQMDNMNALPTSRSREDFMNSDSEIPPLQAPRRSANRRPRRPSRDDSIDGDDFASEVDRVFAERQKANYSAAGLSDATPDDPSSSEYSDYDPESGDGGNEAYMESVALSAVIDGELHSGSSPEGDLNDWDNFSMPDFPEDSFKTHRKKKRSNRSSRRQRHQQSRGGLADITENSQGELRGDESSTNMSGNHSFAGTGMNDPAYVDKADFTFQAEFPATPEEMVAPGGSNEKPSKLEKARKVSVAPPTAKAENPTRKKKKKQSKLIQKVGGFEDGGWPEIPFNSPVGDSDDKKEFQPKPKKSTSSRRREESALNSRSDSFMRTSLFSEGSDDGGNWNSSDDLPPAPPPPQSKNKGRKPRSTDPTVEAVGAKFQELMLKGNTSSSHNEYDLNGGRKVKVHTTFHDSVNSITSPEEEEPVPRGKVTTSNFDRSFTLPDHGSASNLSHNQARSVSSAGSSRENLSFDEDISLDPLENIGEDVDDQTIEEIRALLRDVAASGNAEFMVDLLVNTMRSHRDTTAIQELCLNDIWELSKFNDANKSKIMEAGLAEDIVAAMVNHRVSAKVQENACGALWSLSVNQYNRCVLCRSGAIECIFRGLEEHIRDESFVETAFGALRTLSPESEVRVVISQLLGAQRACRVMGLHRRSTSIQRDGCAFLSNLAVDMDRQEVAVVTTEELEAVVRAMGDHLRNEAVLSGACFALKNFTYEERNLRNLRQFDKIYSLLEDAAKYGTKAECRADASEILDRVRVLKEEDESLEQMAYSSLIEMSNTEQSPREQIVALRDVLGDYDWSVKLICYSVESFMTIIGCDKDRLEMVADNSTLKFVVNAMKRQKHNSKVQEVGCELLRSLSESSSRARSNLCDLDGVNVIFSALRKHRGVDPVQISAFGALRALNQEPRCAKEVDRIGGLNKIRDMYKDRRRRTVKRGAGTYDTSVSSFEHSISTIGSTDFPAITVSGHQ